MLGLCSKWTYFDCEMSVNVRWYHLSLTDPLNELYIAFFQYLISKFHHCTGDFAAVLIIRFTSSYYFASGFSILSIFQNLWIYRKILYHRLSISKISFRLFFTIWFFEHLSFQISNHLKIWINYLSKPKIYLMKFL